MLAAAAAAGSSPHLMLMQAPAAGITHDWLTRLLGYSQQPGIAAAGPVLLAPDGRIASAGIALPTGFPLHLLHGTTSSMDHFFGYGTSVYNVSAVSGILATPRETYAQLGGLDPTLRELALIDYCLRAGDHGQRTVIVPDARLRTPPPPTPPPTTSPPCANSAAAGPPPTPTTPTTTPASAPTAATSSRLAADPPVASLR